MTGKIIRITFVVVFMIVLLLLLMKNESVLSRLWQKQKEDVQTVHDYSRTYEPVSKGQLLQKRFFSLSFDEVTKNPEWVAYHLKKEQLTSRENYIRPLFLPDPDITTGSNTSDDFSGSGFERGHLVPAADMSFDSIAFAETFFLSGIVPQRRGCNQGIWKELEKQARGWAYRYNDVYIMSGPVYTYDAEIPTIKKSGIAVPSHFYKIIFVYNDALKAMSAFLVPNEKSEKPLAVYTVSVDSVEKLTNIDFFQNMLNDEEEENLESTVNRKDFPLDESLYRQRIEKWNAL
jgi:endonuclease G